VRAPRLLSDVRGFLLHRPAIRTFVPCSTPEQREDFDRAVLERVHVGVERYAILNIHRIGVTAPAPFVFEQFRTWQPRSVWWPNRIASLEAADRRLQHIRVYFLGRKRHLFGIRAPLFGLNVIPLFDMEVLEVRDTPEPGASDEARYMLYRCGGGYPVGVVVVYVRSPLPEAREAEDAQVFFVVGFNFYGKEDWPRRHVINTVWEAIHNRVTANVLNRFKAECEARFARLAARGGQPPSGPDGRER
jgi:hypothetical protein